MSPPLKCTNVWCLSLFLSIVLVGSNLSNIRVGWDPFSDNTHLLILHPRRITTVDWVSTRFQPLSQYRDHAPFFTNRIAENASRKTIFLTFNRIVTRFVRTITIDWPSLISLNTISSIAQFKIEYCDCREEETACLHVEHSTTNILTTIRAKVNEAVRGRNGAFFALSTLFFIALHLLTHMGSNADGELGYGDNSTRGDAPGQMGTNLSEIDFGLNFQVIDIASGYDHACALSTNKTIKCWGFNGFGQLGLGNTYNQGDGPNEMGDHLSIVDLGSMFIPMAIEIGKYHACVLSTTNKVNLVKCWGRNTDGELGDGTYGAKGDEPGEMGDALAEIDFGTNFIPAQLAAGYFHTCALSTINTVNYGQLGYEDDITRRYANGAEIVELGPDFIPVQIEAGVGIVLFSQPSFDMFASCRRLKREHIS